MDNKQELQECINECESAQRHLNNAMTKMNNERLQHASKDLQECINECRSML
ncbi:hypothetical protein JMM81_10690 [Bacillus sp. V3B]|uniref:hypothetical protein n=1 Tax=Bacillus sp. V3B TaxID=2804915 RepID=UPI00210BE74B|nr:hypothetical protein [Bacillus sp. V3B]MCQ6275426.1 hypothetical protein [Bacillus sp. V3B]